MRPFEYASLPTRVIFGTGTLAMLGELLAGMGVSRAIILSTPGKEALADRVSAQIAGRCAGIYAGARMHTPIETTIQALARVAALRADIVISVGGGSTIGLGKAIALRTDLPQIAIPTTYSGSEATSILGETVAQKKTTQRSPKVLPEVILYDVELTLALPYALSVASGINAVAHAVEALYAQNRNPIIELLAERGISAFAAALPALHQNLSDSEARSEALFGGWACGVCLGSTDMALHHKLCHILGGAFNLPHAETHTILLPHTLAYNAVAAPEAMARIGRALGAEDPVAGLSRLLEGLGAPRSLRDIGMPVDGIELAVRLAIQNSYPNPEPLTEAGLRGLLTRAFDGQSPATSAEPGGRYAGR